MSCTSEKDKKSETGKPETKKGTEKGCGCGCLEKSK
jgi:hypothetical protein